MACGMGDSTYIKVNRTPLGRFFCVKNSIFIVRIDISQIVPGGANECIHCIRIALSFSPAFRAGDYEAGIRAGVDGILDVLENNTPEDLKASPRQEPVPIDVIIPFMFVLFTFAQFFKRSGQRLLPALAFGGIGGVITASIMHSLIAGGIAGVVLFLLIYLMKGAGGGGGSSGSWSSGSGGWSSGGGGFSGGGGSFGGGGSSGGW